MKNKRKERIAICTIAANNYISRTRVLAKSYRENNKKGSIFVLVLDKLDGCYNPEKEQFEIIELEKLAIPNPQEFCTKYTLLELSCAVKPFLIDYLFKEYGFKKVIYFDSDIMVLNDLDDLFKKLDRHQVLLTPHTITPVDDGKMPDDRTFLRCGAYNAGFIGMSKTAMTEALLAWWEKRLSKYCFINQKKGLFVDQIWLNLLHCFFGNIRIIKEPGYNAAYWNLHERKIEKRTGNTFVINQKPLYFFHFSGFDPRLLQISKYQNRFGFGDLNEATKQLFELYRQRLVTEGYNETYNLPSKFGRKIPNDDDSSTKARISKAKSKLFKEIKNGINLLLGRKCLKNKSK